MGHGSQVLQPSSFHPCPRPPLPPLPPTHTHHHHTRTCLARQGGETRREQLGHEGYSEMGSQGAKKGGYSTGLAHNPEEAAKYTEK